MGLGERGLTINVQVFSYESFRSISKFLASYKGEGKDYDTHLAKISSVGQGLYNCTNRTLPMDYY